MKKPSPPLEDSRRPYKVFVSSTFLDNQERRKLVQDAITMAGMIWHGMEIFTASTKPTVEECLRYAREADLLVGIIAWRYGWEPDGNKSITEMEYDAAKERLMFLINPELSVDTAKDFDSGPERWKKQDKLEAFKARIRNDQMPALFTEKTLQAKVLAALNKWLNDLNQPIKSQPISPQQLAECEKAFRLRIKERFKENAPYYIQLAGETTESVPILEDEKAPRAARRYRQRISAEYCEWITEEREIKRVKLNTLLEAVDKYPCVILLGDPGCGKTTALEYLAYELANDAARLPLRLNLSEFLPGLSVEDFIVNGWAGPETSKHWAAPELADNLKDYLEKGSLFCLFDALNEMAKEGYAERAQALRAFIDQWSPKGNRFLITCRVLDFGEELSGLQRVEIQPLNEKKIHEFVQIELPDTWEALWKELSKKVDGDRSLLKLARNPYMLTVMIDVFRLDGQLGRNRSDLMRRFSEILMGWAKEKCPKEKWLDVDLQRETLGELAFEIQNRAGFGTLVKTILAKEVMPKQVQPHPKWPLVAVSADQVLNLAASAHIIEMTGDRSSLRFYHQLLQEYFAGLEMLKRNPATLTEKWRWPWLEKDMPKWVRPEYNYDPLPPPPPTGWEETTILAAGLMPENDDQLVKDLVEVNPVLAGRCLHEGRAAVSQTTRKVVIERLLATISIEKVALRVESG
jgi:hypothetical protein